MSASLDPLVSRVSIDVDQRQRALDITRSFAVSAPAGSGKTELLIQRYLVLLASTEKPESVLAITFTRKAANEMLERVLTSIEQAHLNIPNESPHAKITRNLALDVLAQDKRLDWNILSNPHRLKVQTIDSLCLQLARSLLVDSGISASNSVVDDAQHIYRAAAEKTLNHANDQSVFGESIRGLYRHFDGDMSKFAELLAETLHDRQAWLPLVLNPNFDIDYLKNRLNDLVDEKLLQLQSVLSPYLNTILDLVAYALSNQEGADWLSQKLYNFSPDFEYDCMVCWQGFAELLLTGDGTWRKGLPNKRLGFPSVTIERSKQVAQDYKLKFTELIASLSEHEGAIELLREIKLLPKIDSLDDATATQNKRMFRVLQLAAAEFMLTSNELGELDHTSIAITALDALGDSSNPTPLALRMDYQIQHILVDEFQDTSTMQFELLEKLTTGWTPDDGRSLFIVGDGMQSIYGFRKANVGLFIKAKNQGIGEIDLEPLQLTSNFRSNQPIVTWNNEIYAKLFPEYDDLALGRTAFSPAHITRENTEGFVACNLFGDRNSEAEYIANEISQLQQSGEDNIAILVRSRPQLKHLLPALRAKSIAWDAVDIDSLSSRMPILDIHNFTRVLCCPGDRIAWLSILRSPIAGLNMDDLLKLVSDPEEAGESNLGFIQKNVSIWHRLQQARDSDNRFALSPEGLSIVSNLNNVFSVAFAQLSLLPMRILVERLWAALGGDASFLKYRDKQDVSDYLDLVEEESTGGLILDWERFERHFKKLYAKPLPQNNTCVQIMTIHKAKGLEFDYVFLPSLERSTRSNQEPLMLWWQREYQDGSSGYIYSLKPAKSEDKNQSSIFKYLKEQEKLRSRYENSRLLYVATTRAKRSLYLSGVLEWDSKKNQIAPPSSNSLLGLIWPLQESSFSASYIAQTPVTDNEEQQVLCGIRRLPVSRKIQYEKWPESILSNEDTNQGLPVFARNRLAIIRGELIHESLMRIVLNKGGEQGYQISAHLPFWQARFIREGLNPEIRQEMMDELEQMLNNCKVDTFGQWILNPNHQDSATELELITKADNQQIQMHQIDRTFIDNEIRYIVDYKSSAPALDQSLEDFLTEESEKYRFQLARYKNLFPESYVKTYLYFPVIPTYCEVI